ncbi:MAG: hypothetical protein PHX70_12580 [Clostridium sp.]|nr:hypothetical protein [Clostridium sp.]
MTKELILNILEISTLQLIYLTGLIILIGFLLGILERITNTNIQRAFGYRGILCTAWIGTPIHELGHAIMCVLFLHNIDRIKLLDTKSPNGVLGYVEHSFNPNNIYQRIGNFFIGIGPILSGIFALMLSLYFLMPDSIKIFENTLHSSFNFQNINLNVVKWSLLNSVAFIKIIFSVKNLLNIKFWIFLIIAFSVSSHIALSSADVQGALDGFIILYLALIGINFAAKYFSINTFDYVFKISKYNAYFSSLLFIALLFSLITCAISYIISLIRA